MAAQGIGTEILIEEANARDAVWKRWFSGELMARHRKQGCRYFAGAEWRIASRVTDRTTVEEIYVLHDAEEAYCLKEGIDRELVA